MKSKIVLVCLFNMFFVLQCVKAQNIQTFGDIIQLSLNSYKAGEIQWQFSKDKLEWKDITGATKTDLIYKVADSGYFRARVSNPCKYFSDTTFIEVWKREYHMNLIKGLNNQGLVYENGKIYVANDIDGINSQIIKYDWNTQTVIRKILNLAIGHGAEIDYLKSKKQLFATNGSGNAICKVYSINIEDTVPAIQRTYNLAKLGYSSLIALNEEKNIFYVISSLTGDKGSHVITPVDIETGIPDIANQFTLPNMGLPNGAKFRNGKLYFLLGSTSTIIAIIDTEKKKLDKVIVFPNTDEPEGLGIIEDSVNNSFKFVVGYVNDCVYTVSF